MLVEEVTRRSAADFFHDNKAIAGFDNPMRAVFTSVRELIENGLDAAEKRGKSPRIICTIERLEPDEVAKLLDVGRVEEPPGSSEYLRLSVKDNGTGVPHDHIPLLFGRVLTGSNYGARQTRGRFGLGAKMVLLNAMATMDLPIKICSRFESDFGVEENTSYYELFIDLEKNEPIVKREEEYSPLDTRAMSEPGTEITVTFTGNIRAARKYILEYFHQLSIITPYATFEVTLPGEEPEIHGAIIDDIPPYPRIAKVHPYGTDITQLKREIAVTTATNMNEFLRDHFQGLEHRGVAEEFLAETGIPVDKNPHDLGSSEIRRIVHEGFQRAQVEAQTIKKKSERRFKFGDPKGDALSPLGETRLKLGLKKELKSEFEWGLQRKPSAYSGHPFIIEAAVAYGGRKHQDEQEGESTKKRKKWLVYRFANRIPLLFGEGNDVILKAIGDIDWSKDYKISDNIPIAFAISLVSTKIPFPETSKEYIANVPEIRREIVRALRACGRELRTYHSRRARERREQSRRSKFEASAPKVIEKLLAVINDYKDLVPFDLKEAESRMTAALATGVPKRARRLVPPSIPIGQADVWIDPRLEEDLRNKKIITANDFLAISNNTLARIKGLNKSQIRQVKRKTIKLLDKHPRSRRIGQLGLVNRRVERIDPDLLPLESALSRRWITTGYDFLATSEKELLTVEGLIRKLIQQEKIQASRLFTKQSPKLTDIAWLSEFERLLKNKEIASVYDFLAAPILELLKVKGLPNSLIRQLKVRINENQIDTSRKIESDSWPWMKYQIRMDLASKDIVSIGDLRAAGNAELTEIDSLIIALLKHERRKLKEKLNQYENVPSIRKLKWVNAKLATNLERNGINTIPDFLNESLNRLVSIADKSLSSVIVSLTKEEVHKKLNSDSISPLISEMYWISDKVEAALSRKGIKTLFDALRTPVQDLNKIEGIEKYHLDRLKQKGTSFDNLSDYADVLRSAGVTCLEELFDDPDRTLQTLGVEAQVTQEMVMFLEAPVCFLAGLSFREAREFHKMGVSRVIDFLVWNFEVGESVSIVGPDQIKAIREMATPETVQRHLTEFGESLELFLSRDTKLVKELKTMGISTVQEFYFKSITVPKRIIRKFEKAKSILDSPLVLIDGIDPLMIEQLLNLGLRQVIDLICCPCPFLKRELGISVNEIELIKAVCSQLREGTPIDRLKPDESKSWTRGELSVLRSSGIQTVEHFYYNTERSTFDVSGISWKVVERLKKRLEAPIEMIELFDKEDVTVESLQGPITSITQTRPEKHDELVDEQLEFDQSRSDEKLTEHHARPLDGRLLDKLTAAGITTVLQLTWWPDEYLTEYSGLSKEEIKDLRTEFTVRETGVGLDALGLEKRLIRKLEEFGVDNVEELYFSLTPEECEEEGIPWGPIEEVKDVLDAPLSLFDRLSGNEVEKLKERGISTVVRFLLGSTSELAQTMETSPDRVTELKNLLDFKVLKESFNLPITILQDLPISSYEKLAETGINTIGEFWLSLAKDLSEITGLSTSEISQIKDFIGAKQVGVLKTEETSLAEVFILPKTIARKLQRAGLSRVSDVFLFTEEVLESRQIVKSDVELQKIVKSIKLALDSPVAFIDNIPRSVLPNLLTAGITTVGRFLISQTIDLAAILKVDLDVLNIIRKELNLQSTLEILELPYHVLPEFAFSESLSSDLTSAGFWNIGDLVSGMSSSQEVEEERKARVNEILTNLDPLTIIQNLSIPLYVIDSLPKEILKPLGRKRITDLYQLVQNPGVLVTLKPMINEESTKLSPDVSETPDILDESDERMVSTISQLEAAEKEEIQESQRIEVIPDEIVEPFTSEIEFLLLDLVDFREIHEVMELPVGYVPGFTPLELVKLSEEGRFQAIRNLIHSNPDEIAELLGISSRDARNRLRSITIERIKARTQDLSIPLFQLGIFDAQVLQQAATGGFSWFTDLYFCDRVKEADFFPREQFQMFFNIANTALAYVDVISSSVTEILRNEGYTRIRDFLLLSDKELERMFGDNWNEIKHCRVAVDFSEVAIRRNQLTPLRASDLVIDLPEEEKATEWKQRARRLFTELKDLGVCFLPELGFLGVEVESLISEDLRTYHHTILDLLESSVFLIPHIGSRTAKRLASLGIMTIRKFLCTDPRHLVETSQFTKKSLSLAIGAIKLADISKKKAKTSIKISDSNAFTPNAKKDLMDRGFYTLSDVLYRTTPELVRSSTWRNIETVKDFLDSPVSFYTQLAIDFPHKLLQLADEGVHSLRDFLDWSPEELGEVLECSLDNARKLQLSMNIGQLRRRKKGLGIRLDTIQGLSNKLLRVTERYLVETVDEFIFGDFPQDFKIGSELHREVSALIDTLRATPDHIEGIDWSRKEVLQRNNVHTVFDFLVYPEKQLFDILSIPIGEIQKIKKEPQLIRVLERETIQQLLGLSKAEKEEFESLGVVSINDFQELKDEESIEELITNEQLLSIIKTFKTVLRLPVSFFDNLPRKLIPKLSDEGINTVDDFLSILDDVDFLLQTLGEDLGAIENVLRFPSLRGALQYIHLPIEVLASFMDLEKPIDPSATSTLGEFIDSLGTGESYDEIIHHLQKIDPERLMKQLDISTLISGLFPSKIVDLLKKRKIINLRQLAGVPPEIRKELQTEIKKIDPTLELLKIDFNRIIRIVDLPVCFAPGFTPKEYCKLVEGGIRSVRALFNAKPETIMKILSLKKDKIQTLLSGITIDRIEQREHEIGIPLENLSVFNEEELKTLSKNNFVLFEDVFCGDQLELGSLISKGRLERFYRIANGPSFYIQEIPSKQLEVIVKHMPCVSDFILLPDAALTSLLGDDWKEMKKKHYELDFAKIEARRMEFALLTLREQTQLDVKLITKLKEQGIENIVDLEFLGDEIVDKQPTQNKKDIRHIKNLLGSEITLIDSLNETETSKLSEEGIDTIKKWLFWDPLELSRILERDVSEVEDLRAGFHVEQVERAKSKKAKRRKTIPKPRKKTKRTNGNSKSSKKEKNRRQGSLNAYQGRERS